MKNHRKILVLVLILMLVPLFIYAAVSDFLILQDIGSYKFITQSRDPLTKKIIQIPGYTMWNHSGVVAGAGHFSIDHTDTRYEIVYDSDITDLGVRVQITLHPGSDSDKWLLHELDADFRAYGAIPADTYAVTEINGNTILVEGSGGWVYRWLSGNKVINIEYTDLTGGKPEPLEIVKAYLAKHPSTLPSMTLTELRSAGNSIKWLKDEMERRLWLCDKWFMALQLGKAEQKAVLQETVKSMKIFLDYREKYFGVKAVDEKNLLFGFLNQNDGTAIKNKLKEYKNWWSIHKSDSISI